MRRSLLWIPLIMWFASQNEVMPQVSISQKSNLMVDSILTRHEKAVGGKAVQKLKSLYATAQVTSPRGPYVTELFSMGTGKLLYRQTGPGTKRFSGYVVDTLAWSYDKNTGRSEKLDDTTAWVLRGHEFQIISLFVDELFKQPSYTGQDSCGDFACSTVTVYDRMNQKTFLFFRNDNGLLTGLTFRKPYGEMEMIRVVFNEWKTVEGLTLPAKITITDNSGEYILCFVSFEFNTLPPEFFAIPEHLD